MAKTEHSTTRKTTKRRQSPKQKAFKKVFTALMQEAMSRFVNDALDIVYGPDGKATSRKKPSVELGNKTNVCSKG
jgi:hypothetical protein